MRTYRELLNTGKKYLERAGIADWNTDAWLLLEHVSGMDRTRYFMEQNQIASETEEVEYLEFLEKRAARIPLQQLTHEAWFFGLPFYVDENVLIPRQDTEILVEEILKETEKKVSGSQDSVKILDMCTGSGCIIISILKNTTNVDGAACDISKQALNVAKENARLNGVFVDFERSDLFEHVDEMYDVIVSNPPYIRSDEIPHLMPEVSVFEPHEALDGSEDGLLFYRRIIKDCRANLKPQGRLLFEIGCDQGRQVSQMMQFAGFSDVQVIKDLAGNDRVVSGVFDSKEEKHV